MLSILERPLLEQTELLQELFVILRLRLIVLPVVVMVEALLDGLAQREFVVEVISEFSGALVAGSAVGKVGGMLAGSSMLCLLLVSDAYP